MQHKSNLLSEDGIIDPVAVRIAISGERVVRMTYRERQAAARVIVAGGADTRELTAKLGTGNREIPGLLASIGYRLSARTGRDRHREIIPQAAA